MGDLLPCPFCGSASIGEPIRRRPLQVACIDCGGEGPEALTHDDACARWNTRATPKPKRDPLTDPRPGDVVRYDASDMERPITARVIARDRYHVTVNSEHGECRYTIEHWSNWSGITTEILHTADEATP